MNVTKLTLTLDIDETPWTDLAHVKTLAVIERIARIRNGTRNGASAVAVAIKTEDGKDIVAQTTLAALLAAVRAIELREQMDRMRN